MRFKYQRSIDNFDWHARVDLLGLERALDYLTCLEDGAQITRDDLPRLVDPPTLGAVEFTEILLWSRFDKREGSLADALVEARRRIEAEIRELQAYFNRPIQGRLEGKDAAS